MQTTHRHDTRTPSAAPDPESSTEDNPTTGGRTRARAVPVEPRAVPVEPRAYTDLGARVHWDAAGYFFAERYATDPSGA